MRRLVPEFILEKYRSDETGGEFQAAAIFVDVSGFSRISDSLAKHGQHGAEVLAVNMRAFFEPLVNTVYAHGGFVIGYAGDAFNALFPAGPVEGQEARRCLSALANIQDHVRAHPHIDTIFGSFPISVKAGMGYGNTSWQIIRSSKGARATYWFRGDSLNGAVLAEKSALPGDIILDTNALQLFKDELDIDPSGGCFRITNIRFDLSAPASIPNPEPDGAAMGIFFPEEVARLPSIGEFRQVVNLFVDIPINIPDEHLVAPFMETIYDLQEQHGGFFLRPELGDKGFNLLMFWGAPTAQEKDIEHALNFALDLMKHTRMPLRIGISYRNAYAGFMGAALCEEYTAYGWGVNLAARLMTNAGQGEIWVDEGIARRVGHRFDLQLLGEFLFKGFTEKQGAWKLTGRKQNVEKIYQGRLIGREEEMQTLARFADPLRAGEFAGVMLVRGEAGAGKSRLVHTFEESDYFDDFPSQWILCQTDELIKQSFQPFKAWLRKRFEVVEGKSDTANWQTFSHIMEDLIQATPDEQLAAELRRTSSVLAALLNINPSDTLYEYLDAKGRYENTFIALSVYLRAESLRQPLVLFVEDIHWLDEDTRIFLHSFIRTLTVEEKYPTAIILTQRTEDDRRLPDDAPVHTIALEGLSHEKIGSLAQDILGAPISKALHDVLNERTDGNPFFAEQILRYLQENSLLKLNNNGRLIADEHVTKSLPMDVRAVMVTRLDKLPAQVRETVQSASVLGREFEIDILSAMLTHQEELPSHIIQARQANIWTPLSETRYIFRHALLRDAAYSMQLNIRQRELHRVAVSAMEAVYQNDLEPHYAELAFHAEAGDLREKALHYLTLAGNLSMSNYLNRQAADYFAHALSFVLPRDLRTQFELLIKRVECLHNLGDSEAQVNDLEQLERLARKLNEESLLARALTRQAYRLSMTGDYQNTVKYAFQAQALAESSQDNETLLSLQIVLPDALTHTGRLEEARQYALQGLEYARKVGNPHSEAYALTAFGLVVQELEGPTTARPYQEQALQLATQVKDHNLEARVLNNLAISVGVSQGDFHTAREYFQQSLTIFHEQGNQRGKGLILANLGWLSGLLGDFLSAMTYHEQALKVARELGQRLEEMYTYVNLSASAYGQGYASDALAWAKKAQELAVAANDLIAEGWGWFNMGYAYLLNETPSLAVDAFQKSIAIRLKTNASALTIESRAGLCEAFLGLEDQASAGEEAEQVIQHMEKDPSFEGMEEPLRVYLSLHTYLEETGDPRAPVVLKNAAELMNGQVSKLHSDEARRMFVENVPWRRALRKRSVL
jgi:predicted ATPase/class 3 adenylate cyclase